MLRTNRGQLIKTAVMGRITGSLARKLPQGASSAKWKPAVLPSVGGITYNLRVGDLAAGWVGDHVEPGVSVGEAEDDSVHKGMESGLSLLSCIGNVAVVASGTATGRTGRVTGKHGGINHVLVDFADEIKEALVIGAQVLVKAFGVGLRLADCEDVTVMNMDPDLLEAVGAQLTDGKVVVPVTHLVPAALMAPGAPQTAYWGDFDIQLPARAALDAYHLGDLRLGDLVAVVETDPLRGGVPKKVARSIGVVVHCDSVAAGHGPGVTTVMASDKPRIVPRTDAEANIGRYLGIV